MNRIVATVFVGLLLIAGTAAGQSTGKTVWDGVYSEAQSLRGETAFRQNCQRCHQDISSPQVDSPLKGEYFMDRWREDSLGTVFSFISNNMPPVRRRVSGAPRIEDSVYADILAYIMKVNGFPAGEQSLPPEMVPAIRLVGRDGPKPLSSSSLIQLVGCLAPSPENVWTIVSASEPARTRESDTATDEELTSAVSHALGYQTFRLSNLDYIGADYRPDPFQGHKMLVKGFVIRQPNAERINITLMESVAATCSQ